MGQIKNIKLHIVTDIKHSLIKCHHGSIQIPTGTLQEKTERSASLPLPHPLLATPSPCRHPPCAPTHPSRQSEKAWLPCETRLRHLQSPFATWWAQEACTEGSYLR